MAGIKISELPEASCITGNELVPIVQGSCTKFVSASAIGGTVAGNITGITTGSGLVGGGTSGSINIAMDNNCFDAFNGANTTLAAASANWDSTTTTVAANSASWSGGGSSFDQDLNTTDSPEFVALSAQGAIFDTPTVGSQYALEVQTNGARNFSIDGYGSAESKTILPRSADTFNLGASNKRWSGVYTGDLDATGDILSAGVNIDTLFDTDSAEVVTVADVSGTSSTFGSSVLYFSADAVTYGPVEASVQGNYYKPTSGNATDELSVAFYSDADEIEIKIERSQSSIQFYVDDVPVHEFAVAGYSNRLLKLSHSTAKVRKYEIRGKSYGFGGVYTNTSSSDYQVWPYETRRERPLLLVMTDSYGTAVNSTYGVSFVEKLADLLDMDLHSDSLNSSGWSSTGSSATTDRADNQVLLTRTPAVILACLGYNDKSSPNQTNIEAGINNWHSTVTGTFGSAAVMLASPWTPVGTEANITTVSGYISGRATALGADFIDINGVVTASNQAAYTSDDSTHPSAAGHDYLARRIQALMLRTNNVPTTY